ncbi:OB-fold protein [Gemmata obscuriglobus]|uniref:Uncharacterized protein n=1 Tax=Gemmata obscuriglobus TaxID=114 RepID=A0A2Z3H184_9BACT|nr:hypothetical protein [Gemmata obscuriglobus]AWM37497.1 hypothetical protein C1280_11035 [Gemmata obscuriglobus]
MPPTSDKPGDDKGAPAPSPIYKVKSEDLAAEFKQNEAAAQAKYSGAVIEVSGKIIFLGLRNVDNALVGLRETQDQKSGSSIGLSVVMKGRSVIGKIACEQEVSIRCTWKKTPLSSGLVEGELLTTGPDTAVRMTSEEFAQQFTADPKGMKEKCRDRTIILRGAVDSGPDPKGQANEFGLKGNGRIRIRCRIQPAYVDECPVPAIGKDVTVVASLWLVDEGESVFLFVHM